MGSAGSPANRARAWGTQCSATATALNTDAAVRTFVYLARLVKKKHLISLLAGALMVAAFALVPAPAGVAQTSGCVDINGPAYCPEPTAPTSPTGTLTKAQLRKRCILKAKDKFGDNKPKQKAAIKKCKKKFR